MQQTCALYVTSSPTIKDFTIVILVIKISRFPKLKKKLLGAATSFFIFISRKN